MILHIMKETVIRVKKKRRDVSSVFSVFFVSLFSKWIALESLELYFFFLSGFYYMDIRNSQDSKEKGGYSL